ncbi:MAG: HDOD domain-containing protein [Pirellulaceae bacterium]|nr:HDOD domain-containing protein [Pirellulaceae bacterium]
MSTQKDDETREILEQLLQKDNPLYTLPTVAVEVLRLTEQESIDVRALKECIEKDPALTAKILRVVNSSIYGFTRTITNLNEALALLGTKPLKLLVLGFSLPDGLFRGQNEELLANYWRDSLARAILARKICQYFQLPEEDEAFLVGLLYSIGQLMLLQELGEPYSTFLIQVLEQRLPLCEQEIDTLGFDHVVFSAKLLEKWHLPQEIVKAVFLASCSPVFSKEGDVEERLAAVVSLSSHLVDFLFHHQSDRSVTITEMLENQFDTKWEDFSALFTDFQDSLYQLADVLDIQLVEKGDSPLAIVQAHHHLSQLAEELALENIGNQPEKEEGLLKEASRLANTIKNFSQLSEKTEKVLPESEGKVQTEGRFSEKSTAPAPSRSSSDNGQSSGSSKSNGYDYASESVVLGKVRQALQKSRKEKEGLCVLAMAWEPLSEYLLVNGPQGLTTLYQMLKTVSTSIDQENSDCLEVREGEYLQTLVGYDRQNANQYAKELLAKMEHCTLKVTALHFPEELHLCVGISSLSQVPKNFPAQEMVEKAQRCLYAARQTGGHGVKSIDLV